MQGSQAAASQAPVGGGGGCRCRGGPSPGPLSPEPYRQIARPYRQCLTARSAAKQLPPPAKRQLSQVWGNSVVKGLQSHPLTHHRQSGAIQASGTHLRG